MATFLRRSLLAALVTVVSGAGLVAVAAPASADPVESGTLQFSGDPGDYITGGNSYSFDSDAGDIFNLSGNSSTVTIFLDGAAGNWWSVDFDAPQGETLTPGTTYSATRYPFNDEGAGFSLSGDGRGCNTLMATFTVLDAAFGPAGEVKWFRASFVQHCEGFTPAARGEVYVSTQPDPLETTVAVSADGTVSPVSGRARVNGEVTCSRPVSITLTGDLSQVVNGRIVRGPLSGQVSCTPGAPVPWTTVVTPSGQRPFVPGRAEADVRATAFDSVYNRDVATSVTDITVLIESAPATADI